jgi:hypothetical protein
LERDVDPGTIKSPVKKVRVRLATSDDDAGIRQLLRQQAVGGAVRIATCREPRLQDSLDVEGDRQTVLVGEHLPTEQIIGCGCRTVRKLWIDGQVRRVGYMGLLRRDPTLMGHVRLFRDGVAICQAERMEDELDFDLTSLVSDNHSARRILASGLRQLPTYAMYAELDSMIFTSRRILGLREKTDVVIRTGTPELLPEIADFLGEEHSQYQFAPYWSAQMLKCPTQARNLKPSDFVLAYRDQKLAGVMAVWDQRGYKQSVIDSYSPQFARWRWAMNLAAKVAGRPTFPAAGQTLNLAFISHWAVADNDTQVIKQLIRHVRHQAKQRQIELLLMTVACDRPDYLIFKRMIKGVSYFSQLYLVYEGDAPDLEERSTYVEAALL